MAGLRFIQRAAVLTALTLCASPAAAETVFHRAENGVAVAVVEVDRKPEYTEVKLQTLKAIKGVCWAASGDNSPYLLHDDLRYAYVSGDDITPCPQTRDYGEDETMVLRFEPLARDAQEFSLVEGKGGEEQMKDPKSTSRRYWNFLHVKLH